MRTVAWGLAALLLSGTAWAQGGHDGHASGGGHGPAAGAAATPATPALVAGEVRKIDRAQGRITLRHGPLPDLGMGAMTMVFRVADPALLEQIQEGDAVRFRATRENGALTVQALERAR
jgi:Cu(I)/Ag(I) efflux system protein CusF